MAASQTGGRAAPPKGEGEGDIAAAEALVAQVEAGARAPTSSVMRWLIVALCLGWSAFQLYIAYVPFDQFLARVFHLTFALLLAFLCYPAYREPDGRLAKLLDRLSGGPRSALTRVPVYDLVLAVVAAVAVLYLWWDYEEIVMRAGLPLQRDIWFGLVTIILLLEAARRTLGPALAILAIVFLGYCIVGPWLPGIIRHPGVPLDFLMSDMYLSDTGIFGVPIGVSVSFVFLFVLFGALLDRAGAGRYFIDVAFSLLGHLRGGPAKAAVVASGLTGLVSGSSIANTVTTGTFTIPLMKKVGLPAHKAGAVEVAASTNGQLMPPVMGAAAFIMAEILGIPYLDVVRAALIPAVISYLALLYVVHLEACKLDLKPVPRSELPRFRQTFFAGLHFLIPVVVLVWYLVVLQRSATLSVLLAIEAMAVIMIVQRPILAWLTREPGTPMGQILRDGVAQGLQDIFEGLINGARNMVAVGVATAAAGIIVGAVTITGLVGRFVTLIDVISFGNIYLMLVLTAITSIILGMGLPTTANYIIMATLTAPVIVQLGGDAGLIFPLIAAHLFVFYFGILADDTPPVGLAAYAAAAIARADPIKTGVQGFTYDMRTAILPFIFLFNTDLLMISGVDDAGRAVWIDDPIHLAWISICAVAAMFAFAAGLQGWFARACKGWERLALFAVAFAMFRPGFLAPYIPLMGRIEVQALALALLAVIYLWQRRTAGPDRRPAAAR
ncbi:MAG: C4-dicarboxylate ABC transporter [Tistrella sp.]|uniref:C4-dicarboxylate ABC transporter n=1 Tax=Tistrella mobilis TaxID=171437 RepID=A0A3B9ILF1_9PROT|nr:TRAP transporter permease [Tistrella sp.]MAD35679.1 C4-dicarboxylate ABC transporter [Tistrella sp.]MBA76226.1 C4-dicarboxylate ABC transporter [Tistrella sp.]HAE48556.1 C4-dicarboxylate ABC transporter [Tistrella mobilis]